jgi:hypothetical protein
MKLGAYDVWFVFNATFSGRFTFFLETRFSCVALAGLKLLSSRDPLASAFSVLELDILYPLVIPVLALCHCNKISKISNFKRGEVYFDSWFAWFLGPIVLGLWWHGTSWQEMYGRGTCSSDGGRKANTRRGASTTSSSPPHPVSFRAWLQ